MKQNFGVIFDMDGVIVHSNPVHKESLKVFLERYEKNLNDHFLIEEVYGRTNAEWIPDIFGKIPKARVHELGNEKEKIFRNMFDPVKAMVPGLKGFLDMLRQKGIKLAVATSAPVENADFILSALSIEDYFDVILDSSHVEAGKPEPEVYIKAAHALGFSPERCIVFEDSLAGVESARRAGSRVIGLTTTHTQDELSDCDQVIKDFKSLNDKDLLNLLFH